MPDGRTDALPQCFIILGLCELLSCICLSVSHVDFHRLCKLCLIVVSDAALCRYLLIQSRDNEHQIRPVLIPYRQLGDKISVFGKSDRLERKHWNTRRQPGRSFTFFLSIFMLNWTREQLSEDIAAQVSYCHWLISSKWPVNWEKCYFLNTNI